MTATASNPAEPQSRLRAVVPIVDARQARRTIQLPSRVEAADVVSALLSNATFAGVPLAAHLWLTDSATGTLRLVHVEGSPHPGATPVAIQGSVLGTALTRGTARIEQVYDPEATAGSSFVWRYVLPLAAGESTGVAAVDFRGPERPNLEKLTPVAGAMRGTLAGALALQIARNEATTARTLADTSHDLASTLDPDVVVAVTLEKAMALAGAQTGSVMLRDGTGEMRIVASRGLPARVATSARVAEGEGIAGWVLATGQPLVIEDLGDRGPRSRRHGVCSAVSVPVADDDGTLGVLNVGSRSFQARPSQSHLLALESLGRTAATALRNASALSTAHDQYFDTLRVLAMAMEAGNPYAHGATAQVLECATMLGKAMALTDEELDSLRIASILHDIGMSATGDVMGVGDRQLSTVEWGMVKMHPVIAADILAHAPALREAIPIVRHHHEHYDGGGYVAGLAGENIPLGARILSVTDAYVAMTSPRPYRRARTRAEALAELVARSGSQFDPYVVSALAEVLSPVGADGQPLAS